MSYNTFTCVVLLSMCNCVSAVSEICLLAQFHLKYTRVFIQYRCRVGFLFKIRRKLRRNVCCNMYSNVQTRGKFVSLSLFFCLKCTRIENSKRLDQSGFQIVRLQTVVKMSLNFTVCRRIRQFFERAHVVCGLFF